MFKRLVGGLFALLLGISLAGCDSLPGKLETRAEALKGSIDKLEATVKDREAKFAAAQKSGNWQFFAPYAQRENWNARFSAARSEINNLRAAYDTQVKTILSRDESKDAPALEKALTQVSSNYDNTMKTINYVGDRMQLLDTGRKNAVAWHSNAVAWGNTINTTVMAVAPVYQTAKVDFPTRAADIDKRFIPLQKLQGDSRVALQTVETQFGNHTANNNADYAAFADAYKLLERNAATVKTEDARYRAQLASLSREYSIVLEDMKIEYAVTVGRSSWDESSDWGEQDTTYPATRVSKADYDYLLALPEDQNLASRSSSWGSWKDTVEIDQNVWSHLGIDMGASWPESSHDNSQFFILDIEPIYFHKYTEVNGRTKTTRDWQEVDEDEFGENANNFGMAIKTKKLGQFEDEVIDQPTPPGMEMVGDPRYGKWVSDGKGGQSWSFLEAYAVYALLTGNNGIFGRGDHDSYRRWRDEERHNGGGAYYGWYGSNRTTPVYGSTGSRTTSSATYRSSPFSRIGGVNAVPRDIRSAGGSARTRGPGSRGK